MSSDTSNTKKSLGQHWLHDVAILDAIVEAGGVSSSDQILEIGPGKGTLTKALLDTGAEVRALEFDEDLLPFLRAEFSNRKNFALYSGDIREFDYTSMRPMIEGGYKVIANIPYYLTSNLIRALSETPNPPKVAVLLIQKEVAHRLCAKPGQMGILSITAQFYFNCELDIEVPARYFTPSPKVDSQVVVLTHREKKLLDVDDQSFFTLVKAGFSEKRKTLRNALSGGLHITKEASEQMIKNAGLKPTARAQELSFDDWHQLYLVYAAG